MQTNPRFINRKKGLIIIADVNVWCYDRIIYLANDIRNISIGHTNAYLLSLIEKDDKGEAKEKEYKREPIKIYINSYGGNLYDMWSLIDIILNSKTPIYTYCKGYAMSAGFKIFLAGHKRFVSKHATLLYHQLSGWTGGHNAISN